MPYAYDYIATYKAQIKAYWEGRIVDEYGSSVSMKNAMNAFLDGASTAATNYINRQNLWTNAQLRYRFSRYFGFLTLAVLYRHCMEFPVAAGLPEVPWFIMPLNTGDDISLGDLRSLSVAWRYSWPGDGMTSYPWFLLAPGTVSEIVYAHGLGEATMMKNVFNNNYPLNYTARYSNTTTYNMGNEINPTGLANIVDTTILADYDKFSIRYDGIPASAWEGRSIIDRVGNFLNTHGGYNYNYPDVTRYQAGVKILNYIAAGNPVTMIDKPRDWMLANGGQELMDFFGWDDINGNIL